MNIKKTGFFLSLILVGFFIGCFAACAPSSQRKEGNSEIGTGFGEPVTLVYSWWGNPDRSKRSIEMLDLYQEEHENLQLEYRISEWADYWSEMAISAAGHELPDLLTMDYFYLKQYADKGLLLDLTSYIDSGIIDVTSIDPELLDTGKCNDAIFAVCQSVTVPMLMYNKTLLDSQGITLSACPDLEEFLRVSKEVYEKTGYKTNIAFGIEGFLEYFCRAYDQVLYEEGQVGASQETLEKFYGLYEQGYKEGWLISPDVFARIQTGKVEVDPLVRGSSVGRRSWCSFFYSKQMSDLENAAAGAFEIGLATWPSEDPIRSEYIRPGQFFCISTDSEHPEESAELINYMINSVEGNRILLGEKGLPVSETVDEAIRDQLGETDQRIIAFVEQNLEGRVSSVNPLAPAAAAEAYTLNRQLIEKVCYGEITAKEAAEAMLTQGNRILQGR